MIHQNTEMENVYFSERFPGVDSAGALSTQIKHKWNYCKLNKVYLFFQFSRFKKMLPWEEHLRILPPKQESIHEVKEQIKESMI